MRSDEPRAAAFLDRDGTIIRECEYLADPAGVELLPGSIAGLRLLSELGYRLVVVTNQAGVARGLFDLASAQAVQRRFEELLTAEGVRLAGAYMCPHHPDFTGPCECRKPGLALYRQAAAELGIDLATSVYIGDKLADVEPAAALGGTGVLVRSGYGRSHEPQAEAGVLVADDLEAAARLLPAVAQG